MPIIEDIRVYESKNADNPYAFSQTGDFFNMYHYNSTAIHSALLRFVMKLREYDYTLENSHLYMVLTPGIETGGVVLAEQRKGEFSWMRVVFLGINRRHFNRLNGEGKVKFLLNNAANILCDYFSDSEQQRNDIRRICSDVIEQGKALEITYREKTSSKYVARVYVKVITPTQLVSYICVVDDERILFKGNLPDMSLPTFVQQVGSLNITQKSVTVKPRTGSYAKNMDLKPLEFEFRCHKSVF